MEDNGTAVGLKGMASHSANMKMNCGSLLRDRERKSEMSVCFFVCAYMCIYACMCVCVCVYFCLCGYEYTARSLSLPDEKMCMLVAELLADVAMLADVTHMLSMLRHFIGKQEN